MTPLSESAKSRLKTPKAAAIAGILFSVLILASLSLLRISAPTDGQPPDIWLNGGARMVSFALTCITVAGVAFLWFVGVLRDRLGQHEDRLFATVFLGSGLLFLAMLFASAAVAGTAVAMIAANPDGAATDGIFRFARALASDLLNVYAAKLAVVFMISTSTVAIRTDLAPRSVAILGYVAALFLLFGSHYVSWSFFVFPLWVLLLSTYILMDNLRHA